MLSKPQQTEGELTFENRKGYENYISENVEDKASSRGKTKSGKFKNKTRKIIKGYIKIILYLLPLLGINLILLIKTPTAYLNIGTIVYTNISWILVLSAVNMYPTDSKETIFQDIYKTINLFTLFGLTYFARLGMSQDFTISSTAHFEAMLWILLLLLTIRLLVFYLLKKDRFFVNQTVNVVVLGRDRHLKKIRNTFSNSYDGFNYVGYFDEVPSKSPTYLGKIGDSYNFIIENNIHEVFCIASKFDGNQLKGLIRIAENNLIRLRIIPDIKGINIPRISATMFEDVPVVNFRPLPLDKEFSKVIKRIFDITFSLVVILFVLSWLYPIIALIIKFNSKGPVIFKQQRHGYRKRKFMCYKFRTMKVNQDADTKMATKDDDRITNIGKFLRKTSLDEMPQFLNVFLGNMSVVGPRPHMILHTEDFASTVDKYLVRHLVKPGITGMAQIKGYRGEIKSKHDIIHRLKYDIFYAENWTLRLDIIIIAKTIMQVFKKETKAY